MGEYQWKNYQSLPNCENGDRKLEGRNKFFLKEDFENKNILDLGCWGGQMMLFAKELGAKEVLGVEIDSNAIKLGRELGLEIIRDDLENPFLWRRLKKVDTILCLAILGNMRNQIAVLSNSAQLADVMYIEGHGSQHNFDVSDYMDLFLKYTNYKTIEFLGTIDTRPFFRLSREEKTIDYILSKNYNKVALIGKPGAGKTYFTKFFEKNSVENYRDKEPSVWGNYRFIKGGDVYIYSDIEDGIIGKKYIVDSHGALTLTDFDCVVDIYSSKETRLRRLEERIGRQIDQPLVDFSDTISPLYKKGAYNYYLIKNE